MFASGNRGEWVANIGPLHGPRQPASKQTFVSHPAPGAAPGSARQPPHHARKCNERRHRSILVHIMPPESIVADAAVFRNRTFGGKLAREKASQLRQKPYLAQ